MKKFLLVVAAAQLCLFAVRAQTFTVDTILNNGNKNNRINLVFLAEGYTSTEQTQFITDVNAIVDKFFLTVPLSNYKPFFNVYAVRVVSAQSGTKHPGTAADCGSASPLVPTMSPTTYFNATFDYGGTHRLLYTNNSTAVNGVLQTNTPWYDKALIVVNSAYYGGSGGAYPVASTHASSAEIMIHEFGHSFAGLADEYGGASCTGQEKPNVTQETNPNLIKWKNWIAPGTAIPTPAYTNCGNDGLYNGANYCTNGWYRSQCDCKMRTLNQPFCDICKQEFIVKIMQYVNLVDTYTPANTTALSLTTSATQLFSAQVLNSLPNTVKIEWKVDNALVATNTTSYLLNTSGLSAGAHTVTMSAWDTTSMVRLTLPVYTTAWNLNVQTGQTGAPTLAAFNPVCSNITPIALSGGLPVGGTYSGPGVINGIFTPSVAGPGTHTITYTYNSQTATQSITVSAVPNIVGTSTASVCSGSSTSLSVSGATSYSWSPSTALNVVTGSSVTSTPTTSITYTVTGTNSSCTVTKVISVSVVALPNVTTSGANSVCNGSNTTLSASGATTYSWTPATGLNISTGSSVVASPISTTTYSVTGTANGCSKTIPLTLTVNASPQLTGPTNATVCMGSSSTLTVGGATTYSWSPITGLSSSTGASVNATPGSNITYTIIGTQNGCSNTKLISVNVTSLPTITVTPTQNICAGNNATLTASGATTFTWTPSTSLNTSTGNSVVAAPANTITYTVTGLQNGCGNAAVIAVQVTPLPTVSASSSLSTLCTGGVSMLSASGATSYTWTPATYLNASNGNSVTSTPSQNITYTVTGTSNGCSSSSTVSLSVNTLPVITTSGNTSVCTGSSTNLTANGALSYTWSPSIGLNTTTGNSVTALPTSTTTYTVSGFNGCSSSTTMVVTVNTGPQLTGSANQSICSNTSAPLNVSGANSYTWAPATGLNTTTGSNVTASPSTSITYTVTGFTGSCNATKVIAVNVTPTPQLTATQNVSICNGSSIPLTVSGATTYTWSPAAGLSNTTGTSVSAYPSATTNYTVTGTTNGCVNYKTITVTIKPTPVLTATPASSVCSGSSLPLSVSGATTYSWSPAASLNVATGTNAIATPSSNTTYTITGTTNGCNGTKTIAVAVNQLPSITGATTNASCNTTGSINITSQGTSNNMFAWSNGATLEDISGLNAGAYSVTVTSTSGCSVTQLFQVTSSSCTVPVGFVTQGITANGATVKWNAVSCSFGYKLRYKTQNGSWIYNNLTDTFKIFSGLVANTTYQYQVQAWCNEAHTDSSGYSSTQTIFTISGCGVPTGLSSSNITSTTAKLQWTPVPGAISYKVRYIKINGGGWIENIIPATQSYLLPTNLSPSSTYKYQLRSICGTNIMSGYSVSKYFTTLSLRLEELVGQQATMNVYPNPASSTITVEATFAKEGAYTIELIDMTGRVLTTVEDYTFNGNLTQQFNIDRFASGIYFARIIKGDDVLITKLLKQQ